MKKQKQTKMTNEEREELTSVIKKGIQCEAKKNGLDVDELVYVIENVATQNGNDTKPKRIAKSAMRIATRLGVGRFLSRQLADWVQEATFEQVYADEFEPKLFGIFARYDIDGGLIRLAQKEYKREREAEAARDAAIEIKE